MLYWGIFENLPFKQGPTLDAVFIRVKSTYRYKLHGAHRHEWVIYVHVAAEPGPGNSVEVSGIYLHWQVLLYMYCFLGPVAF